jgi:hypothetical protein
MRTVIAIGFALAFLAACGGEVTAAPQRATSDGGSRAPSAPRGADGSSESGIDSGRDGAVDSAAEAAPLACTMPSDCLPDRLSAARCCIDGLCSYSPPASCADVKDLAIVVSSYDQSCSADSDCTTAAGVSACYGPKYCDYEPIAKTALSQYESDVAMLPTPPCVLPALDCPPPPMAGWPCSVCCRSGACQVGDACCGAGDD